MEEMIDKFDLVIFGVRFASKHLHKRSDYMRYGVEFASKEMFESSTSHVKYGLMMGKLLFNKDWLKKTAALDVLKYIFYVMHIIYSRDLKQSYNFYEAFGRNITSWLSEDPVYFDLSDLGLENDNVIREAREYSEKMFELFSDDEIVDVDAVIV